MCPDCFRISSLTDLLFIISHSAGIGFLPVTQYDLNVFTICINTSGILVRITHFLSVDSVHSMNLSNGSISLFMLPCFFILAIYSATYLYPLFHRSSLSHFTIAVYCLSGSCIYE